MNCHQHESNVQYCILRFVINKNATISNHTYKKKNNDSIAFSVEGWKHSIAMNSISHLIPFSV